MLKIEFLEELLVVSIALSILTCAFIQKTKSHFKTSKYLPLYSLIVNLTVGIIFCMTFTNITFPTSLWVGMFSFLGADTIYKSLEGKLLSYNEILNRKTVALSKENIKNKEDILDGKANLLK